MMNEPYEDDSYYDEEENYHSSQNNSGGQYNFQFDVNAWDNWLSEVIKNLDKSGWSIGQAYVPGLPVNDWVSSAGSKKHSLYLGNNQHKEPVFKNKYFIHDQFHTEYKNHLIAHAVHFLKQPNYYEGMFDILN